jgi:hemerythrin-like domain-containing protein
MNAIEFLKSQHQEAKAGFQKIERAKEKERASLWKHLSPELKLHEQMEEQHLYDPVSGDTDDAKLASWPERHADEVQEAERMILSLDRGAAETAEWLQTAKRLHAALDRHIQEEEKEIWPRIERTWSHARLDEAGAKMAAMKSGKAGKMAKAANA